MKELLEKDQIINVVTQNLKNSNKGRIIEVQERNFTLELFHTAEGISVNKILEFYSQTKNGMLYFNSAPINIEGNSITIQNPRKHKFLQRRAYTRLNFSQEMICTQEDKEYKIHSIDISAGGMRLKTNERLDLDSEYDLAISLKGAEKLNCKLQLIRIEKNENGSYTLSGRFQNLSNVDKMTLIQFCMRKSIENANR